MTRRRQTYSEDLEGLEGYKVIVVATERSDGSDGVGQTSDGQIR